MSGSPPSEPVKMKCCFKECDAMGLPSNGFDFFACEECLMELEEKIREGYREKFMKRHVNN